ncbi:MAG: hypothetical protein RLZ37_1999 [Actinomycetota bacterium]|jgi:hypothetical protein
MNSDSQTTSPSHQRARHCTRSDRGQATSEYALVMLAAALIALLAVGWASSGDGAGKIGQMFDRVIEDVTRRVP